MFQRQQECCNGISLICALQDARKAQLENHEPEDEEEDMDLDKDLQDSGQLDVLLSSVLSHCTSSSISLYLSGCLLH